MFSGEAKVNPRVIQILRFAGLILPIVATFYGLLIQYDAVSDSHYLSDALFFGITTFWVLIGSIQFLYQPKNSVTAATQLIVAQVLAATYLLTVSGFGSMMTAIWIILLLATQAYFGYNGMRLSIVALVATAAADSVLHADNTSILISNSISLITILLTGIVASSLAQEAGSSQDNLERSRAEESLERDRILTIINNMADAVLSTDEKGIVRVYNAASLNLLDTNESPNGKPVDEVLTVYDSEDKPLSLLHLLRSTRGTSVRDDLTAVISGDTIRLELTYSPIRSGYRSNHAASSDGYVLILRDITKSKSLEEERDEFISVVSHELRTPITVAEGTISNAQLLLNRKDTSPKSIKENLLTAHEQILYLAKMVNDLSTLSRAERGVADAPEVIEVRDMVDELYAEYQPQAQKKNLAFNLDLDVNLGTVYTSRLYLKELLQNFITNAIKYTRKGSVTLIVKRSKDRITFSVKDTGIGISKNEQEKVFDKFYRSEDYRTRETGGTGLGLYVATKLAKKLGTKIELTSRLNHGSTFSIALKTNDQLNRR